MKKSGRRVTTGTISSASQNTGDVIKKAAIPAILAAMYNLGQNALDQQNVMIQ